MSDAQHDPPDTRADLVADFAAYALGALDPERERQIEDLVSDNLVLQEELNEMMEATALLAMSLGEKEPSPQLRGRLLHAFDSEVFEGSKAPIYTSLINHIERSIEPERTTEAVGLWHRLTSPFTTGRVALATSLASFAVVAILAVQLGADNVSLNYKVSDMERSVQSTNSFADKMMDDMAGTEEMLVNAGQRITEQSVKIEELTTINEALRASVNDQISLTYATLRNEYQTPSWLPDPGNDAGAYVHLLEHRHRPLAALVVGGMVQAPLGEEYRLYLISEDGPHYVASFDMNEAGYCTVLFPLSSPLSEYNGAHITRERVDAEPNPDLAEPANRYRPQ